MENNNGNILIVDDDQGTCLTLEALLIEEKYNLIFANNGMEALSKAKKFAPDLILLDVMMPDLDGYEVCERLRADAILAEVPIIMITALNDRNFRIRGIESGADDFISKPFDQNELLARIRTTIRLNRYHQLLVANRDLGHRIAQLSALYDISNTLNSSVSMDNSIESIVEKAKELLNVEDIFIILWDEKINRLYVPLNLGKKYETMGNQVILLIFFEMSKYVLQEGSALLIQNMKEEKSFGDKFVENQKDDVKSALCVPLNGSKNILGIIGAFNKRHSLELSGKNIENEVFSKEDQELLEVIANNISSSIERGNLYQKLEESEMIVRSQNVELKRAVNQKYGFENVIGNSDVMIDILRKARQISTTDTNILLYGETGTGKEIMARAIHQNSLRSQNNFVPINCGAIPENLLESELFGHEKGSFTGASSQRIGRFEEADGGTLFLDEIGDMPLDLQTKLLRVLQDGIVQRLGSNRDIPVDFRVIAATHRDLEQFVAEGRFRQDLYYRLKVFVMTIPTLRERVGDIILLVDYFISYYSEKMGKKITGIDANALDILSKYDYPGNVRELQNIIESAIALCKGETIEIDDLSIEICTPNKNIPITEESLNIPKNNEELKLAKADAIRRVELMFLNGLLSDTNGNVSEAARKAGMNRTWLIELMGKHNIDLGQL